MSAPPGQIVLWSAEAPSPRLLSAAQRACSALNIALDQISDLVTAVDAAFAKASLVRPCLLVLAPAATMPMSAIRPLSRKADANLSCLVVTDVDHELAVRRALAFADAPGGRWRIEREDDPDLHQRMLDSLAAVGQKRRLRTTLDRMNVRLAAPTALDSAEHRRLVASDHLFSSVMQHASDAIVALDTGGFVQTWNRGAELMFSAKQAEAVGTRMAEWFQPPALFEQLVHAVSLGVSQKAELSPAAQPSKIIHGTIDQICDYTGKALGSVLILRDVTAERRAAEAVLEVSRQKDEFLAMLAHELRNPIAPIANASNMLKQRLEDADPQVKRLGEVIARQTDHLTALLNDLLDVSRVTRGAIELERSVTSISQVVSHAVEQNQGQFDKKHQLFRATVAERLFVVGDAARLVQVMSNILNNASKYAKEGGHITLEADSDAHKVRLEVVDDGIGIAPCLAPRLFQLFSQGTRGVDRTEGGLGIGLALVKSLVELHGGTVRAESAGPQKGSRFTIELPRAEAPENIVTATSLAVSPSGSRLRVMVVDDNEDAAETLGDLLKLEGHEVAVETDPANALKRADDVAPDVYILDIGMPQMDGYELARRLRTTSTGRAAVLVAHTGYGQAEDMVKSRMAGFDHHLVKPLDVDKLWNLLREVSDRLH